VGVLADE
jgi:hypothetical protein